MRLAVSVDLHEIWEEHVAITLADDYFLPTDAVCLEWEGRHGCQPSAMASHVGPDDTHA